MDLQILSIYPCVLIVNISLLMVCSCYNSYAQAPVKTSDSSLQIKPQSGNLLDSSRNVIDTSFNDIKRFLFQKRSSDKILDGKKKSFQKNFITRPSLNKDSLGMKLFANPYAGLLKFSHPLFRFDGGYIAYNFNYRSSTDTPYQEKNIAQHMVNGSVNFSIAKNLPFIANVWIRRSNSQLFRDITDVQVVFNAAAFRKNIAAVVRERFLSVADGLRDSVLEKTYFLKQKQSKDLTGWLQHPFQLQKLIEANEILRIPGKTHDPALPDSTNKKNSDSLRKLASDFMALYYAQQALLVKVSHLEDSLGREYRKMNRRIQEFRELIRGEGGHDSYMLKSWEDSLKGLGAKNIAMPPAYKWLLGVRSFGLGKNYLNYSELSAKNINLTGINFEYNSWYYLAISAGWINYRFHDFVVNRFSKTPQYMYMLRAGLGRVDGNHFILSVYRGQKQLFVSSLSTGQPTSIQILGLSAEVKWRLNRYSYMVTEAAESLAPDYRYHPAVTSKFNFSEKTNKALSVKLYSYLPSTGTRLEGMYKYTGANFQSFSSFQTNSALSSWYIKGEQSFLKRKLKVAASLRSNDFSNPYIVQNYKSNMVFKSVSATLRIKKWPSLMIAYMPMSQLTVLGTQVIENRFQTLIANVSHFYKIGNIRATTIAVLTKFYNSSTDSSFLFYNAGNLLVGQSLFFSDFTTNINLSKSVSSRYTLNVAAEDVNFHLSKICSLGIGVKINQYNKKEIELGQYINLNMRVGKADYLSLNGERGFIPGSSGNLVLNDMGNIQFVKRF
jgi:hypothetical protein